MGPAAQDSLGGSRGGGLDGWTDRNLCVWSGRAGACCLWGSLGISSLHTQHAPGLGRLTVPGLLGIFLKRPLLSCLAETAPGWWTSETAVRGLIWYLEEQG